MGRYTILLLIVLFLLAALVHPAGSSAAPYYAGKVINIIVGYGPGGGYDRMARMLAKNLPNFIPGKPTILVQNMPGADSIISANYLYNIAKPDGLAICTFNRALVFAQLLKQEGVKFDLNKFAWIGSAVSESTVLVLRSDLPYKTLEDVARAKSPIILGNNGPADGTGQLPLFLREFLGYNFKFVTYPSSNDIMLAIERKELDGRAGSYSSLQPFIDRGLVRPIARGRVSEPSIDKLPVDEDLSKNTMVKTLMAMRSAIDIIGRPYVAPPGTPAAITDILKNAFAQVAKDPAMQRDAKKMQMSVQYITDKEVHETLKYLLVNQPPDVVNEFAKYVKF